MPGLVPGIPLIEARPCQAKRDGRDEPGHGKFGASIYAADKIKRF